jgi:hypothetical protein
MPLGHDPLLRRSARLCGRDRISAAAAERPWISLGDRAHEAAPADRTGKPLALFERGSGKNPARPLTNIAIFG